MAKITKAEFKRVLIAAEAERAKHPIEFKPDGAAYPKLRRAERAGEKMFADLFRKAGLDTKALAMLRTQHSAELERIVEKQKAAAIKSAARGKDTIHSSITSQAQALQELTASSGFFPFPSVSLDKPFLIWATPHSNIISDSHIESFNSWAKIKVDSGASSGQEKLSFYFLWDNPTDFFAVINASTFVSATGHLKATAFGGLSGIDPTARSSTLGCAARFALWSWWRQPPVSTDYDTQMFNSLWASAGFLDSSETATVSDAASLNRSLFIVPPRGVVVLEAVLQVGFSNSHGHVVADFESGNFKIACPVVVVSVLTSPSIQATAAAL